uniref:CCDC92 domain-containing protein n=1 Tax=Macrostomum lignano TaxID=282301 RepID=A0A1I8H779_9PLAT
FQFSSSGASAGAAAAVSDLLSRRIRELQAGVVSLCNQTVQLLSQDLTGLAQQIDGLTDENRRLKFALESQSGANVPQPPPPPSLLATKKWSSEVLPPSVKVSPAKQRLSDSPRKTASNSNKRKLTLVLDQQQSPNKLLTGSRAPHQHNNPSDTSNLSSKRYRQTTLLQTDA